ncbi:hypothetical protein C5K15_13460, partial [Shigella dysenteriae]
AHCFAFSNSQMIDSLWNLFMTIPPFRIFLCSVYYSAFGAGIFKAKKPLKHQGYEEELLRSNQYYIYRLATGWTNP